MQDLLTSVKTNNSLSSVICHCHQTVKPEVVKMCVCGCEKERERVKESVCVRVCEGHCLLSLTKMTPHYTVVGL